MGVSPKVAKPGKPLEIQWERGTLSHWHGHDILSWQGITVKIASIYCMKWGLMCAVVLYSIRWWCTSAADLILKIVTIRPLYFWLTLLACKVLENRFVVMFWFLQGGKSIANFVLRLFGVMFCFLLGGEAIANFVLKTDQPTDRPETEVLKLRAST